MFIFQMISSTVTQLQVTAKQRITKLNTAAKSEHLPSEYAEQPLIWRNIIGIAILHILAVYSLITSYKEAKFWTWIFSECQSTFAQIN